VKTIHSLLWKAAIALGSIASSFGAGDVVINEIMYQPASGSSEEEFIELINVSNLSINLSGWQFTRGIHFMFPNVTVLAGNYLIVAANTASFANAYQVTTTTGGNWTESLSNGGERLTPLGAEVCDLIYSDEGNWANRIAEPDPDILQGEAG
jgi:hypothetical protein